MSANMFQYLVFYQILEIKYLSTIYIIYSFYKKFVMLPKHCYNVLLEKNNTSDLIKLCKRLVTIKKREMHIFINII